jgi:hypothetical protein
MAERRMFAKTIIDSDAFLDMPQSSQNLYFHLSMRADDDGFINNPKKVQRMVNASDDDLKLLCAKNFIIPFESGIVVIKHWKIHNYLRNDRYKPTVYQEERRQLGIKENGAYTLTLGIPTGIPAVTHGETQVRLGKVRLGKDKTRGAKAPFVPPSLQEIVEYCKERGKGVDPGAWLAHYESNGWMVGKNRMKDWRAAVRTWEHTGFDAKSKPQQTLADRPDAWGAEDIARNRAALEHRGDEPDIDFREAARGTPLANLLGQAEK